MGTEDALEYEEGALEAALEETGDASPGDDEIPEIGEDDVPVEDSAADDLDLEEEATDDEGVQEHLKEAVEGTLRLKRMLSHDDEAPEELKEGKPKKRRVKHHLERSEEEETRIKSLLLKWGLAEDRVARHVLEDLATEEVKLLSESGFAPEKFNPYKQPAELIHLQAALLRERNPPGGGTADTVLAFRSRWKLPADKDPILRKLSHKDLRYVISEYNGETPLEDVIAAASSVDPDESSAIGTLPEAEGNSTMGRFNRLELIDPLADAAVFGDANLSFAVKLAKHRKALGHVGRVIATTFETLDCLRERYPEIDQTIKILEDHYAEVYHGVDCTRIAVDPRFKGMEDSLGAVYYNFPHAGAVSGFFDGHPCVNWRHENLMRLFFRALRSFVKPGGLIKVASNKGAVGVRYSYIIGSAVENEFSHVETVPFLDWHLHRYGRSYGDKRDAYRRPGQGEGYNVQRADSDMVYTFEYQPSGNALAPQKIRYPPKFGVLMSCVDGPFRSMATGQTYPLDQRKKVATQLYKRFMTECSGIHVG